MEVRFIIAGVLFLSFLTKETLTRGKSGNGLGVYLSKFFRNLCWGQGLPVLWFTMHQRLDLRHLRRPARHSLHGCVCWRLLLSRGNCGPQWCLHLTSGVPHVPKYVWSWCWWNLWHNGVLSLSALSLDRARASGLLDHVRGITDIL